MKALLIGGTGVLSTDVALYAIEKGMEVFVLNRGNRLNRIPKGASSIIADIRNVAEVESRIKDLYFDVVVDFLSFVPEHIETSISLFEHKCKQLIFISSATVYHNKSNNEEITEQTQLSNPFFRYAENKIKCERLLEDKGKASQLNYTIVRPYVTYGNTRIPFAVIPPAKQWSLINRILLGKPIVMWDEGDSICTLTHTTDFAKGLVGLFGNDMAMQNTYHITSNERFKWKEVLKIIAKAVNKEALITNIPSEYIANEMPWMYGELLGDKATNMIFDNTKIKKAVPEFICTTNFYEGIRKTIAFYRKNPEMMRVDYFWDSQIDRLIHKYYKEHNSAELRTVSLKYMPPANESGGRVMNRLIYAAAGYRASYFLVRLYRRFRRSVSYIVRVKWRKNRGHLKSTSNS